MIAISGNYSAQIVSHQEELSKEEKFTDKKSLIISSLQTDYLNLDCSSGSGRNSERANTVQKKCTFCGGTNHSAEKCFKSIIQEKEKVRVEGDSDNKRTKRSYQKQIRYGSDNHLIAKFPKPPKDNEKRRKQVRFNEKVNRACDNGKNNSDQKIYESMARMSSND